jgi:hypothetical protein
MHNPNGPRNDRSPRSEHRKLPSGSISEAVTLAVGTSVAQTSPVRPRLRSIRIKSVDPAFGASWAGCVAYFDLLWQPYLRHTKTFFESRLQFTIDSCNSLGRPRDLWRFRSSARALDLLLRSLLRAFLEPLDHSMRNFALPLMA